MADDDFRVPVSSLDGLEQIIQAYAHFPGDVGLDELERISGTNRDTITRNNSFLTAVGIIQGGQKKGCTAIGRKLGRALEHDREDEVSNAWREVIRNSEFLSDLVSTVRLRSGMSQDDLTSHTLFAADQSESSRTKTGATTVVNILIKAGVLEEEDGELIVARDLGSEPAGEPAASPPDQAESEAPASVSEAFASRTQFHGHPNIAINIELQLPETENATVYENLFRALREHLLTPQEDE